MPYFCKSARCYVQRIKLLLIKSNKVRMKN